VLSFIELTPFAKAREAYGMTDDEFAELQAFLAAHPEAGAVIPASSGCRKLRWGGAGRGKRGGYRVIYFLRLSRGLIVLVLLYGKHARENVESALLRQLHKAVEHEQDEG
jgi:mRNA-degrading endonuclease RelE of RelBE toxin-antitoxin system